MTKTKHPKLTKREQYLKLLENMSKEALYHHVVGMSRSELIADALENFDDCDEEERELHFEEAEELVKS